MKPLRASLAAGLLVLATAACAHAAPPWSAPLTLGPPSNGSEAIAIGFGPRGEGLLSWRLFGTSYIAPLRGDGGLGPATTLPADLAAGPALALGPLPTLPGSARAIVVMHRLLGRRTPAGATPRPFERSRLTWAVVRPDATLGPVRTLTVADCLTCQVSLAVNWLGEAIAVWRDDRGVTRAAFRPAGARFGAPVTIFKGSNGQYPDLRAAIGTDGRAIVVDGGAVVRARVRTRNRGFGPVMRVGRGNQSVRVSAAISNGGKAIVAWGSQDGGEDANEPWVVRAARLRRGGRRFSATQTLDAGSAAGRPEGRIALAFTPGGKATVAWSAVAIADRSFPVMAAAAARGGRFGAAQQLAPSGAVGAVAVRADGAAVVVWSALAGSQQPVQVFGSVRPAGALTFGAPEAIGEPDEGFFPPIVAFDPASGRPTTAWGSRPTGSATSSDHVDATVHVATRAAP
ncbi:MAG TPA: hypothetical protein VGO80_15650 [Solirubrobacteraceae bacterium]|jgi:hypothetical protein|nr:hypothetical protein [Solirubrobacteraceae bacterium]